MLTLLQKQAPKTPEINNLLSRFYILRGEQTKGIKISKQFLNENPDNFYAWYYYSQRLLEVEKNQLVKPGLILLSIKPMA